LKPDSILREFTYNIDIIGILYFFMHSHMCFGLRLQDSGRHSVPRADGHIWLHPLLPFPSQHSRPHKECRVYTSNCDTEISVFCYGRKLQSTSVEPGKRSLPSARTAFLQLVQVGTSSWVTCCKKGRATRKNFLQLKYFKKYLSI
jgi:hypothetical protein